LCAYSPRSGEKKIKNRPIRPIRVGLSKSFLRKDLGKLSVFEFLAANLTSTDIRLKGSLTTGYLQLRCEYPVADFNNAKRQPVLPLAYST
jgi:hypothetical protein